MASTILLTGATGFLGSALAANLLREGHRVLCLGRSGPDKIRRAVEQASVAVGWALTPEERSRLEAAHWELGAEPGQLPPKGLDQVDMVWHCAAEMSYSRKRSFNSMITNVAGSVGLLRVLKRHAPNCRRFHYVSTAYSAGLHRGPVPENLVVPDHFLNGYQMSKSMTELSLAQEAAGSHIALSIIRPSICVGHSKTGAYEGSTFGLYMFLESYRKLNKAGVNAVRMDLDPTAQLNLLPIDQGLRDFMALTNRDQSRLPALEVLNCVGDYVPIGAVMEETEICLGTRIECGKPKNLIDQVYDRAVRANKEFAGHRYRFSVEAANRETGRVRGNMMESSVLKKIVHTYFHVTRDEPLTRCWKERMRFALVSVYAKVVAPEPPASRPGTIHEKPRRVG
ncbi:MAG: SDR family oxidoreductase [Vulcanimicrobiota bacterium]